ncbi:hypothetical protein GCM10022235_85460 [Kribbella ginsengisoli]|uniref:ATP-binding protein n=1 Tax=Kribbella ginsengisoli TaxID=363865 RepID=A0ABP6ZCU1_9ACTN
MFRSVLQGEQKARVLYIHGPGGCGKTALLNAMRALARQLGRATYSLDIKGHEVAPSPPGLSVTFVDDADRYPDPDALRDDWLKKLPASAVVVLAGRREPDIGWHRSGWEHVMVEIRLAGLSAQDSHRLLTQLGVPASVARYIRRKAAGSPLALVMAARAFLSGGTSASESDIARRVMAVVGNGELDPRFHQILHISAIARLTTPNLLASVLDIDPAPAFTWLAERSFVERVGPGLAPYALVRPALRSLYTADGREQDRQVLRQLCDYYYHRATAGDSLAAADLAYLIDSPVIRWGFRLEAASRYRATGARRGDRDLIDARMSHHDLADWWNLSRLYFEDPGTTVIVARDNNSAPVGYAIGFVPARLDGNILTGDPIGAACVAHAHDMVAATETLVWRDTTVLPRESSGRRPTDLYGHLNMALALRAPMPNLRHAIILAFGRESRVHAICREAGGRLVPKLHWLVNGREVSCYHIDWGPGGFHSAERDLVYRELQIVAPNRQTTADDVREALDGFLSDHALADSPLAVGTNDTDRTASARAVLRSAAEFALAGSPHAAQLRFIVDRRFFTTREPHARLARALMVSRATYFRRLEEAIDRIATYVVSQQ